MADSDASETLTVTQVDDPPETPERVITEQVLRNTPLRNALAVFEEGVATVQVENVVNRAGAIIYIDERRYIEYEGETYLVEQTKS